MYVGDTPQFINSTDLDAFYQEKQSNGKTQPGKCIVLPGKSPRFPFRRVHQKWSRFKSKNPLTFRPRKFLLLD
ncbi:MAG TPA: hypothetical protein DCM07_09080 [Planctomycetaceae bacterium]|nr:hypothetical protein [Gimesia sp.]HAH44995.1 hypothetical protein [Planctomycetaceae bacterium]HBL44018.1 hypothetical protein [Planctomycetaceae bacterium]